jgi:hypothetical protein
MVDREKILPLKLLGLLAFAIVILCFLMEIMN